MTDEARTLDELLVDFADNHARAITPQKMRNFALSSVLPPIYSDRFIFVAWQATHIVTLPGAATEQNYGPPTVLPLDPTSPNLRTYSADGPGWLGNSYTASGSDPTSAWGLDIAANQAILLPPGVYATEVFALTASAEGVEWGIPPFLVLLDQAEYDPDLSSADGSQPYIYDGYYGPSDYDASMALPYVATGTWVSAASTSTLINDTDEVKPFIMLAETYGYTEDVFLNFYQLIIRKVE